MGYYLVPLNNNIESDSEQIVSNAQSSNSVTVNNPFLKNTILTAHQCSRSWLLLLKFPFVFVDYKKFILLSEFRISFFTLAIIRLWRGLLTRYVFIPIVSMRIFFCAVYVKKDRCISIIRSHRLIINGFHNIVPIFRGYIMGTLRKGLNGAQSESFCCVFRCY